MMFEHRCGGGHTGAQAGAQPTSSWLRCSLLVLVSAMLVLAACGGDTNDRDTDDRDTNDRDANYGATDDGAADDVNESESESNEEPADGDEDSTDGDDTSAESTTTASTATTTAQSTTQSSSGGGQDPDYDPGLKPLVDQARADLAGRLGVGGDAITLVSAELRTWPDSAIGCPRKDMNYLQVPTDGAELIFSAGGGRYRYTTGGEVSTPRLCEA